MRITYDKTVKRFDFAAKVTSSLCANENDARRTVAVGWHRGARSDTQSCDCGWPENNGLSSGRSRGVVPARGDGPLEWCSKRRRPDSAHFPSYVSARSPHPFRCRPHPRALGTFVVTARHRWRSQRLSAHEARKPRKPIVGNRLPRGGTCDMHPAARPDAGIAVEGPHANEEHVRGLRVLTEQTRPAFSAECLVVAVARVPATDVVFTRDDWNDPGCTPADAPAADPVRRWQRVQWQ